MDIEDTRKWIERSEGRKDKMYIDSKGHPTIGIGFNLDRGDAADRIKKLGLDYDAVRSGRTRLTDAQIDQLFTEDLNNAVNAARRRVSNFDDLPDDKQKVVADMIFNMGEGGFGTFKKMIDALEEEDYERAAKEMKDSAWYKQVGDRARRDIETMKADPEPSPTEPPTGY